MATHIKLPTYWHKQQNCHYVQLDFGKKPDGKRNRKQFYGKTKKEARDKARAFLEKNNYSIPTPTGRTVGTYLTEWFDSKKAGWSGRTQELYQQQINKHIAPRLGSIPLEELAPLDIQKMVDAIFAEGKRSTANKCRGLLFSALKQAVRWELISKNPAEAVDPVREPEPNTTVWEPAEAEQFLDSVQNDRLYAAFYLMYATGIRRGELLGLRWEDLRDNGLRIERSLVIVNNKATFKEPKTKRSRRFIAVGGDTIEVLEAHRQRQIAEREACGAGWDDNGLVFSTTVGTPIHPRNFLRTFKRLNKNAGVRESSPHGVRHLHASLLIARGVDAKTISERLGHTSTSFTLDRYGHLFREHQQRHAFTVASLFGQDHEQDG